MQRLVSSGLAEEIGREYIFVSTHDAVDYCLNELDNEELMSRNFGSQLNLGEMDMGDELVKTDTDDNTSGESS